MKLITARQNYKCEICKKQISKGQKYIRKTKSYGSPRKETFNGTHFVIHGYSWSMKFHESCKKYMDDAFVTMLINRVRKRNDLK